MKLQVSLMGEIDYKEALEIQKKLLNLRQQNKIEDTMMLLEHPAVLTLGKAANEQNVLIPREFLKEKGVSVYEIDRGGDVTYHGPGQIVGYPILDLANHGKDVRKFVYNVEEVFIRLLKEEYSIEAGRDKEHRGTWVGNDKITALGFAIKKWVSMHGFAFNVNTNLENFRWINPCGILDKGVTSLEKILGYKLQMDKVTEQVIHHFSSVFNLEYEIIDKSRIYELVGSDFNG